MKLRVGRSLSGTLLFPERSLSSAFCVRLNLSSDGKLIISHVDDLTVGLNSTLSKRSGGLGLPQQWCPRGIPGRPYPPCRIQDLLVDPSLLEQWVCCSLF